MEKSAEIPAENDRYASWLQFFGLRIIIKCLWKEEIL
jgi:hypothetical protein